MPRSVVRIGDRTSHGGVVVTGDQTLNVFGQAAARKGDMTTCPKCKGSYPIVEGTRSTGSSQWLALEAYALIAGDENNVVLLQAADCDCNEVEERERQAEEKVEYTLPAAEALYTLIRLYMRGRLPPLPGGSPAPVPAMP